MSRLSNATRRLMRPRDLIVQKDGGGERLISADFADRLREPVDAETALLADLQKDGASQEDLDAAAGAVRLLDSVGYDVGALAKESTPEDGTPLDERLIPPWFVVEIENAKRKDPQLANLDDETIMRQLLQAHPEWADDGAPSAREAWDNYGAAMKVRKERPRSPEERARLAEDARRTNERIRKHMEKAERERVEKERRESRSMEETMAEFDSVMKSIEIMEDEKAGQRIDEAAARIRKADPSLSKAEAGWKACVDNPELYAAYERHQARQQGWLDDSPERIRKAADAEAILAAAARPYIAADPSLSHSQAVAKALEADPSLYTKAST